MIPLFDRHIYFAKIVAFLNFKKKIIRKFWQLFKILKLRDVLVRTSYWITSNSDSTFATIVNFEKARLFNLAAIINIIEVHFAIFPLILKC